MAALPATVELTGEVAANPDHMAKVPVRVAGRLVEVTFQEGQRVAAGDVLASIESSEVARIRAELTSTSSARRRGAQASRAAREADRSRYRVGTGPRDGARGGERPRLRRGRRAADPREHRRWWRRHGAAPDPRAVRGSRVEARRGCRSAGRRRSRGRRDRRSRITHCSSPGCSSTTSRACTRVRTPRSGSTRIPTSCFPER